MITDGWNKVDTWRKNSADGSFTVEVTRFPVRPLPVRPLDFSWGSNGWQVHAYISDRHPHFAALSKALDADLGQGTGNMPLHCGCTFRDYHRRYKSEEIGCVEIGADYRHLHDDHFSHYETPEQAGEVFMDAEALFAWLAERIAPRIVPAEPPDADGDAADEARRVVGHDAG
jgi:hypothetical protein